MMRRAAKAHTCDACLTEIDKGEHHAYHQQLPSESESGEFESCRLHLRCDDSIPHFAQHVLCVQPGEAYLPLNPSEARDFLVYMDGRAADVEAAS